MNIRPLGSLDTLVIAGRLRIEHWDKLEGAGDVRSLPLMDDEGEPLAILKRWKAVTPFVTRLRNAAAPLLGNRPAELGRVWIEALQPHGHTPWTEDAQGEFLHVRLCLSTPLNSFLYCGGESTVLLVGSLAYLNTAALHSWVNLGDWPAIHLCADVRRPEPAL